MIPLGWYLVLLTALAAERIFELYLARRNARCAFSRGAIEVGQRHYHVMAAMHTAFIASCAIEAIHSRHALPLAIVWGALVAEALAQALRYWAVATLGERWNTRVIVTPEAAPVTGGPYRFLRHPNYLAVVIEIAAVPLIGGAIVTAIVFSILNAMVLAVRIHTEERALGAKWAEAFGARPRRIPTLGHGPRAG